MVLCVICRTECKEEKKDISTLRCGHTFHSQCIIRALRHSPRCPTCRDCGKESTTREDAIAAISESLLERIHTEAVYIHTKELLKSKMREVKQENPAIIEEYEQSIKACLQQSKLIKKMKKDLFKIFKEKYYQDYKVHHGEFKNRKRRLYRAMSQLKTVVDVNDQEWRLFSQLIYEDCGKDTRVPFLLTF